MSFHIYSPNKHCEIPLVPYPQISIIHLLVCFKDNCWINWKFTYIIFILICIFPSCFQKFYEGPFRSLFSIKKALSIYHTAWFTRSFVKKLCFGPTVVPTCEKFRSCHFHLYGRKKLKIRKLMNFLGLNREMSFQVILPPQSLWVLLPGSLQFLIMKKQTNK